MGDAFRALVDAADLRVTYGYEVCSDDTDWTLDLDVPAGSVWIASAWSTIVWVTDGDRVEVVHPGTAALFSPGGTATIGTSPDRHPPPIPGDDIFSATGVFLGTATSGPLAHEVLEYPGSAEFLRTRPRDAPSDDVLRTLDHLTLLTGGRWHAAGRDALARLVVLSVLLDNPPSFLADGSLARCIDRLSEPGDPPSTDELLGLTSGSITTLRRRFRTATGCTPEQLRRWFRSLPVRRALAEGVDQQHAAERFGFSTVSSMRRALTRVRAPEGPDRSPF